LLAERGQRKPLRSNYKLRYWILLSDACRDWEARILKAIAAHYPTNAIPNETAASEASYSAALSSYANPRSALKTKDLIGYPAKDHVRAAYWLFAA